MIKKLLLSFIIIIGFSVATFLLLLKLNMEQAIILSTEEYITIEQGDSVYQLSEQLMQKGWIPHRFWLRAFVRLNPEQSLLKAGTYKLSKQFSLKQLLILLTQGKEHQFSITFIEGTTIKEWLVLLSQHKHITQTLADIDTVTLAQRFNIDTKHPEGWFFPDTYAFTNKTTDVAILQRAHDKMKSELSRLWKHRETPLPYKNQYQALIMASIIEKESAQSSEKPMIASVFVNRLNKKMRLQTDPTVIYGMGERYNGNITRKDLREKTAYNTYRINGLPPTPIAMPGLAALEAVMAPASTNYLYFVSQGNGHHVFSTNLADHNRAVARYQLGKK